MLYVNGGEYVKLTCTLSRTVKLNDGTLIPTVGCTVQGNSTSGANLAAENATDVTIKGSFVSVTGAVTLSGASTISGGTASISGYFKDLTIGAGAKVTIVGDTYISGLSANDTNNFHVTLAADTEIRGGAFGASGDNSRYALTVKGETTKGHVQGQLRQLTVSGGTVEDCGALKLANDGTCLAVTGGKLTLDNGGTITARSAERVDAVVMTGGELTFGTAEAKTGKTAEELYVITATTTRDGDSYRDTAKMYARIDPSI